jgi:hypothetical protein
MQWDHSRLLTKAELYCARANDCSKDDPLFGFWSSLYLELLARAALAKIHPSLLADPKDGSNILYGFGVQKTDGKPPISIPAKSVYHRCVQLISGFDINMEAHCNFMAGTRNLELHSGEAAFEPLSAQKWITEQFSTVEVLCKHIDVDLTRFFIEDEQTEIRARMALNLKESAKRSRTLIDAAKMKFDSLTPQQQLERKSLDAVRQLAMEKSYHQILECPACKSRGVLSGDYVASSKVSLKDDELVERKEVRTSLFQCPSCELELSRELLLAIQLPSSFYINSFTDPVSHFGVDLSDYVEAFDDDTLVDHLRSRGYYMDEPDYGND